MNFMTLGSGEAVNYLALIYPHDKRTRCTAVESAHP
jgi:hypothetical protein